MNKKVIISLVLIGVLAFGAGIGTYAWFTSNAITTANTFTAGTLTVGLDANNNSTEKEFAIEGNLQPGDFITKGQNGYSSIEIKNTGNLDIATFFRFAVTEDAGRTVDDTTYKLADMIIIDDMKMEFLTPTGIWLDEDHYIKDGKGHGDWPGWYNRIAGADNKISLTEWVAAGNTGMGLPFGWQKAGLKKDNSQRLTFRFKFSEAADDNYQGLTLKAKFEAHATQVNAQAITDLFSKIGLTGQGHELSYFTRVIGYQNALLQ